MKKFLIFLSLTVFFLIVITSCALKEKTLIKEENIEKIPEETVEKVIVPMEELPLYSYNTREISLENNGQRIYGLAFIPENNQEKFPLIILSHGLGGSYQDAYGYAEAFASHGIAAYTFDFRGGGGSASDGTTTEMSVLTEVSDLEVVLEDARSWDFVDKNKIVLLGASQGGLVDAVVASEKPNQVAGLILTYPAFNIPDAVHQLVDSPDQIPEAYSFGGFITLGKAYAQDVWDLDVYALLKNYPHKVLLLHGSADPLVPLSYSQRAAELYPDADFFIIEGAEHGFYGTDFQTSLNYIFDYLQQINIL